MPFAIKVALAQPDAEIFSFPAQKTMYGGKTIAVGDTLYVFASENEGGVGLVARAVVTSATADAPLTGVARQTPRVTLAARRTGVSERPLGRRELKTFRHWSEGRPETELNFKLYRQATNKVVGLSPETATFLAGFFSDPSG